MFLRYQQQFMLLIIYSPKKLKNEIYHLRLRYCILIVLIYFCHSSVFGIALLLDDEKTNDSLDTEMRWMSGGDLGQVRAEGTGKMLARAMPHLQRLRDQTHQQVFREKRPRILQRRFFQVSINFVFFERTRGAALFVSTVVLGRPIKTEVRLRSRALDGRSVDSKKDETEGERALAGTKTF